MHAALVTGGPEVVLGSASPARLRVLRQAGLEPRVLIADLDEDALVAELAAAPPTEIVTRLAAAKADALIARVDSPDAVLLTCDSMLRIRGELVGKPHTPEVARQRWVQMSGQSANLLTGHCITRIVDGTPVDRAADCESTEIRFATVDTTTIDAYVSTGEPLAVAGSFTLDGYGGWFVDGIDGDPSSVIGISLPLTRRLLARVGVDVTALWSPRSR
ncbi:MULTISPECIES: Maf family protein [unclassified Gordonia (in: high G+C Gram-positive bacteria)]|uniref:Maf family protein n=1 Tax=unclassified Gordonia (in: high G+C Gram-positive bacteria) TaxID=2657482 RepID=UPI0039198AA7